MISRLSVRCLNSSATAPDGLNRAPPSPQFETCEWQGKLCEQQAHLKECPFSLLECSHAGCTIRSPLLSHPLARAYALWT
eukprot:1495026-Rhodomonas_salina.2